MARQTTSSDFSLHLNVIVQRKETARYEAHCLELDLVAEGPTTAAAVEEVLNLVDVQVRTCIETDNLENLFCPAPKAAWNKLAQIRYSVNQCKHERSQRPLSLPLNAFRSLEIDQYCYA
jgi:hypothetical protein